MSIDNLEYAEFHYYKTDVDYRKAVTFWLKEHGMTLRTQVSNEPYSSIGLDTIIKGRDAYIKSKSLRRRFTPGMV